jgi:RNA polymerase sigma-70 factor (ECF subfamily)
LSSFFSFFDKKSVNIVSNPNELDLLASLKNDDPVAIKVLFELYHNSLCFLAYRMVRDRDVAKDIVQDVFLKFWNSRKALDITSSFSAYLKRSVINTSLNHLEKDRRHIKVPLEQLGRHPLANSSDQGQSVTELSSQLEQALNKLPVRTRAVFILIRREEMTYKEVAASLDISTKAVEKEMMKALKLLREMLKNFLPAIVIAVTSL